MNRIRQIEKKLRDIYNLMRMLVIDRHVFSLVRRVRQEKLTYLEISALVDLYDGVAQVEKEKRMGVIVEAGCALGGSSLIMAAAKSTQRPFFIYDAFEMIPPPSANDGVDARKRYEVIASGQAIGIKGDIYYGYQANLQEHVRNTFTQYGFAPDKNQIHLVKGYYENTLYINEPVALAHIDCDWHDSVMVCLQRIEPHLVPGGILIIDDYHAWSGCRTAVDNYFANRQNEFEFVMKSRLHIIRK